MHASADPSEARLQDATTQYLYAALIASLMGSALLALEGGNALLVGWPTLVVLALACALTLRTRMLPGRADRLACLLSGAGWAVPGLVLLSGTSVPASPTLLVLVAGHASLAAVLLRADPLRGLAVQALAVTPMLVALLTGEPGQLLAGLALPALVAAAWWVASLPPSTPAEQTAAQRVAELPSARPAAQPSSNATDPAATALASELERLRRAESELQAAKTEAEAANMAKGEFLATISHEMRTPLNGIIPLLDILRGTRLEVDQRDYVETAYRSANEMLRIVDDVLDYSKIEANKLELEVVGLNLRELLDSVTRLMGKAAEKKGLRLEASIDPQVRIVGRGDPVRLRQVLTNLVSNAIKFTERGSVSVHLSRRADSRDSQQLLFTVKDTGVGISSEAQQRLFQPFTQADASTTRHFGGTGLGLVICRRIVELMGGQIGVHSEPGRGSSFWFQIPLLKALGDIAPARSELVGVRALLLGNDPAMQQRLQTWLANWGLKLEACQVAAEAAGKLKSAATMGPSWTYELLVIDPGREREVSATMLRPLLREAALDSLHILALSASGKAPAELAEDARVAFVARSAAEAELRKAAQSLLGIGEQASQRYRLLDKPDAQALELPARPEPAKPAGEPAQTPAIAPVARAGGAHVLLVEDNAVNRQVAKRLLSLLGVEHDDAENGREALQLLASHDYDAVLMDCQMPLMDGYTATRARRQLEHEHGLLRVPIIAMTANAMAGDREKCLASGMDDYLSKPLNRSLLGETLQRWIPQPRGRRERSQAPGEPRLPQARPTPAPAASISLPEPPDPVKAQPESPARPSPHGPAASAGPVSAALDRDTLDDLIEVMGREFVELVRIYLEDSPKNVDLLRSAASAGNIAALVAPAHSLKSTSANLGALQLSALAKDIEHSARHGSLADPQASVARLSAEHQRVAAALTEVLREAGS